MTATEIKIPLKAAKYIVLQRFETQKLAGRIHYSPWERAAKELYRRFPVTRSLFELYSTVVEPTLRGQEILAHYAKIMRQEVLSIKEHLPPSIKIAVSIGPGVAGFEAALNQEFAAIGRSVPRYVLIDKSRIDAIDYGFKNEAAAYNSLAIAMEVLLANGCGAEDVELVEAENADSLMEKYRGDVDLITSLIAWGFHFPVQTYLALAVGLLKPHTGRLIIDIRKGTDGLQTLQGSFREVKVILDDYKFQRVVASTQSGNQK